MAKKFPIAPKAPERSSERIQHPIETDGREWYRQGDWSNLLSDAQLADLGLKPAKPHFKLPLKKA